LSGSVEEVSGEIGVAIFQREIKGIFEALFGSNFDPDIGAEIGEDLRDLNMVVEGRVDESCPAAVVLGV
jgi:hypothetical protein